MFGLFKKSIDGVQLLDNYTDVHCHILPGVDDGVQKMEHSLKILDYYEEHGVKRVFLTPHVMSIHPNTRDGLLKRFDELKSQYKGGLALSLGAEYMIDEGFTKMLDEKEDFLCASPNTILIETSEVQPPLDFSEIIFELQQRGYDVMLAHPERYRYMKDEQYNELYKKDVKLQMNLLSIDGTYGNRAQEKAKKLLSKGLYSYVGSDLHKLAFHRERFALKSYSSDEIKAIRQLIENNNALPIG